MKDAHRLRDQPRPGMLHIADVDLQRWYRGELSESENGYLEEHLCVCEQCANRLETLIPSAKLLLQGFKESTATNYESLQDSSTFVEHEQSSPFLYERGNHSRWIPELLFATGGIGEVWIAIDQLLGRTVALKRLKPETAAIPSVQSRFLYEAEITAQLDHSGTVSVFDLVKDGPNSFYTMTLVRGAALSELIKGCYQHQFELSQLFPLLRYWVAVARTIAFAHSQQVLHRDLKSENVVVGEFGQVTVLDWGLAKRVEDEEFAGTDWAGQANTRTATRLGSRLGTPSFMAPEQASGNSKAIDERTDVWGLSAVLYEVLTGRPPFVGVDPEATMAAVLQDEVVPPSSVNGRIPESLSRICEIGLAKEAGQRTQSVSKLLTEVDAWINKESEKQTSNRARQKLFDLSDDLMFVYDMNSRILWGNAAWKRKLGWDPEEKFGERAQALVHPDDQVSEEIRERVSSGETVSGHENRIRSKDGHYRWYSWTLTPIIDEGIVCAVGHDIEDHRQREFEYRALLDAAPDATLVVDHDISILMVNGELRKLFDYSESELVGRRAEILIPNRFHSRNRALMKRYFRSLETASRAATARLTGIRKGGGELKIFVKLSPVKIDGITRVVASIRPRNNTD